MSTTTDPAFLGLGLLNAGDFYVNNSILHPLAIGSITIVILFLYLRVSSNRTTAPLTIWDKIVNVALGSTLAGIINGNSLVKGLIALAVLLLWQFLTSVLTCLFPSSLGWLFTKPPVIVAFRGSYLEGVMRKNRITKLDINGALRKAGVFNICQIECIIVEPTGVFSIHLAEDMPKDYDADVLLAVKGYRELVKHEEESKQEQKHTGQKSGHDGKPKHEDDDQTKKNKDKIANDAS